MKRVRPSLRVWIALLGVAGTLAGPVAAEQECHAWPHGSSEALQIELPREKDRVEYTFQVGANLLPHADAIQDRCYPTATPDGEEESWKEVVVKDPLPFFFKGDGLIEIGIFITGIALKNPGSVFENNHVPIVDLLINGQPPSTAQGKHFFRTILRNPQPPASMINVEMWYPLLVFLQTYALDFRRLLESVEVTVVMQRVQNYCTMAATVTGDINGYFFGDIAFYNEHAQGIAKGMAAGSVGDTEAWKAVDQLIGASEPSSMCANFIKLAEKYHQEIPEECRPADPTPSDPGPNQAPGTESFSEAMKRELAGDGDSSDNFGLSLVDMKLDDETRFKAEDVGLGLEGAGFEGLRALTGAGFTLNLSGRTDTTGKVRASTLMVSAGAIADVGAIKFELPDAAAATVLVDTVAAANSGGFLPGTISADLETRGAYIVPGITSSTPRQLKINVQAAFGARKGSMSCMR